MPKRHVSELVVGRNLRVALWCDADATFIGNPASVEEASQMWQAHLDDYEDEEVAQSPGHEN